MTPFERSVKSPALVLAVAALALLAAPSAQGQSADMHGPANNLTKQTALSEKGEVNNGAGDSPNRHDILTGTQPDGTAFAAGEDKTCKNWSSSTQGAAVVGHADRKGLRDDEPSKS